MDNGCRIGLQQDMTMSRRTIAVGLFILVAAGSALGVFIFRSSSPDAIENEVASTDSWLHPATDLDWSQWDEIPKERLSSVSSASQAEAIRLLKDVPVVELMDKDLKTFAPDLLARPHGLKPYLIRGVFLQGQDGRPMGTGHFVSYHRGKDVLVYFGCLGRRFWGMSKGPLVIWLPFKPEKVFVACGMVE
jgi:hypothetical protein